MELEIGQVAFSKAGRDKGNPFIILSLESTRDGDFAYLADGKTRSIAAPKKKKIKHLQPVNHIDKELARAIIEGRHIKDSDIKKCLTAF